MKTILYYLLQMMVTSGILYGYYHFVLRNKRFHRYNRFYLLAATALSIIIPFLNIPVYFTEDEKTSSFVLNSLYVISSSGNEAITIHTAPKENWFTIENVLYLFYGLIALIALIRIFFSLYKIKKIIRNNTVEPLDNICFVNTTEPGTPFSFFRWLFWNRNIELGSEKGEQIFRHELFHINQKHSADILYLEFLSILFWINPFFHLIRKEIKAIHEFLADQFAVTENKQWQYAELLLMQVLNTNQPLVNPFFHNQIKRRIAMITTSKKPGHQYARKLMVLPVAAIVIALFAFSYKSKDAGNIKGSLESTGHKASISSDTLNPSMNSGLLSGNIVLSNANSGNSITPSKIISNGQKNTIEKLTFEFLDKEKVDSGKFDIDFTKVNNNDTTNTFLIIIDGVILSKKSTQMILSNMNPSIIQSINVYKEIAAISKYGERGKNGAIEITTKKLDAADAITKETTQADTVKPNIADNKIFDKTEVPPLFPGGDTAWRKYLEKNADGLVPMKNGAQKGMYTVIAQFIVDIDGTISNLKTLTHHGFGMEEEVTRLIAQGPKWIPAIQNGKKVKAYVKQPVSFQIEKENPIQLLNKSETKTELLKEVVIVGYIGQSLNTEKNISAQKGSPSIGGMSEWRKYLERNISSNVPLKNGVSEGIYKIEIQFLVKADGTVTDIKPMTKVGYGMEEEALRVIKKVEKWEPAISEGKKVNAYKKQPVTFQIIDESVATKSQR